MPSASKKKDLYVGKSLADLNKLVEEKLPKFTPASNAKVLCKSAEKVYKNAEESNLLGDEERAYVLYMKYLTLVQNIQKTRDFKKDETYYWACIGKNNMIKALELCETLSKNLKDRYDYIEAEHLKQKLDALDKKEQEAEKKKQEEEEKKKTEPENEKENENDEATVAADSPTISVQQVYNLFNDDKKLIIMDIRSETEYENSHINHRSCINVPSSIIPAGCTVKKIEQQLPPASRELWHQRQDMEYIVLTDWKCSVESLEGINPIHSLKDALWKWDSMTTLRYEPQVLDGGYDEWLLVYPTLTTNSNVSRSADDSLTSSLPSLDFDYPDFDQAFLKTPDGTLDPSSSPFSLPNGVPAPNFNRSLKPKVINNEAKPSNGELNAIKNVPDQINNLKDDDTNSEPDYAVPHKTSKVNNIPSVDRTKKPELKANEQDLVKGGTNMLNNQIEQIHKEVESKKAELASFKKDKDQLVAEHKARLAQISSDEEKLERLTKAKKQEEKQFADLMRKKRKAEQELKELEEMKAKRDQIQHEKEDELKVLKQREAEVDRLRKERKLKEEQERQDMQEEAAWEQEQEEARQKQEALAAKQKQEEAEAARCKKEDEDAARKRQEYADAEAEKQRKQAELIERQKLAEAEKKRKLEEEEKERQRKLTEEAKVEKQRKLELEKQEKKLEEERIRKAALLKAQEAEKRSREEAAKAKKLEEEELKKKIQLPGLPVGWEKKLDPSTGRYYYIDHQNKATHWNPPEPTPAQQAKKSGQYKMKLKDEPSTPSSGGLKRSSSSPNIAKLLEDENESNKPFRSQAFNKPDISRSNKPTAKVPESLTAAQIRNFNPTYGNKGTALTGLRNMGNTCYMNSTLQALNNTTPLVTYLLSEKYKYDLNRENFLSCNGEIAEEFADVVKALWMGQYSSITPRDFKMTVGKYQPMFSGYQQQDSQELLLFLMDGLHEDLNKVKERPRIPPQDNDNVPDSEAALNAWKMHKKLNQSIIVELFQGQFKSTVQCMTCRKTSITFDAFMYLSVPLKSSGKCSLQECLQLFAKTERITGGSRWKCPRCDTYRDAVKNIVIWKLPPILLIHLKRFYQDHNWKQKISSYVDFPLEGLDLRAHVEGPECRKPYNLYAVSNHYGTMEGGHYTAFCRSPVYNKWYKFDDHEVLDMSRSDIKSPAAYILFYTSIDMRPPYGDK